MVLLRRGVTEGGKGQLPLFIGGLLPVAIVQDNGCSAVAHNSRRASAE